MFLRTPKLLQSLFPQIIWQSPNNLPLYTFDDGPNSEWTPKFSELLAKHNKKGIFFIVGDRITDFAILNDLLKAGHSIGWHSQTHRSFLRLSKKERLAELNAAKVVEDKLGQKMAYFRFPYGRFLPAYISEAQAAEMQVMMWSYLVSDYKNLDANSLVNRLANLRAKDILLYHDSSKNVSNAFQALEIQLKNR